MTPVITHWNEIYDWAGLNVRDIVRTKCAANAYGIDVGAGQGKYRILLPELLRMDACEIWQPAPVRENLEKLYTRVYHCDAYYLMEELADVIHRQDYQTFAGYDVAIFGDVLEHMTVERAQTTLRRACFISDEVIVVVPYLYPQEPHDDNEHQRHIQDDLTPEVMTSRYPELRLVMLESREGEPFKGIYRRR